jgi:hypothetical protein
MIELILDNYDNHETLPFELPIVPRIGDWIVIENEEEFTEGEIIMVVRNVILSPSKIIVVVNSCECKYNI